MAEAIPMHLIRCEDQHRSQGEDHDAQVKLRELADQIAQDGQLLPIEVRPAHDGTGQYIVTFGERRYRAHQLLGKNTIKAEIVDADDYRRRQNAENLVRENVDPVDEGRAHLRAMAEYLKCDTEEGRNDLLHKCRLGLWPEDAERYAITAGAKSTKNLRVRVGLLFLPEAMQEMVHCKELSLACANTLVALVRDLPGQDVRTEVADMALKAARGKIDAEGLGNLCAKVKATRQQAGFSFDEDPIAQRQAQVARNSKNKLESAIGKLCNQFWNTEGQRYDFNGLTEGDRAIVEAQIQGAIDAAKRMAEDGGFALRLQRPAEPVGEYENPEVAELADAAAEVVRLSETNVRPDEQFLSAADKALDKMHADLVCAKASLGAQVFDDWTGLSTEDRKRRAATAMRDNDKDTLWSMYLSYLSIYGKKRSRTSKNTTSAYKTAVGHLWEWCADNAVKPHQLTREDGNIMVRDWQTTGTGPATCNQRLSVCRSFCEALRWVGMMGDNAFSIPPVQDNMEDHLKREAYSEDELSSFLRVANPVERAMILLAADGGLRASEIACLCAEDIDPVRGIITVQHGKGDKRREVGVTTRLADALDGMASCGPNGRLFCLPEQSARCRLYEIIQACAARAGITPRGVHALRHTCGTRLYERTQDPLLVAQHLGHADLSTVGQYVKRNDKKYAEAVTTLNV